MGKPLSRPGCFRRSSCCLEKHGAGDVGVGGRVVGMETRYGDGYIPQRSIYETMCMNEQIDRRDFGAEGSFSYSASGSLRVSRSPVDMCDPQPRSLTPNPSFVRRLDERAIYDSLKLGCPDVDGNSCHSPGHFPRSVSPSVSSFSAPGVSSSSKKHHHHYHHHHGDSAKSRDGRQSWKVLTPPKHLESLELTTTELIDRGSGCLNPGQYPPTGVQSLTSPVISPFSASPLSSGYHTPVFFSPAKPRPSQSQSLRCSPPHVIQPRHYSQSQSLRLSPPHELRRSPYRTPLVQLSVHDLEQDLRDRGGGWGRSEREREWEREREREMERGWTQPLEKRRPHGPLQPHPGHFSENQLSNKMNPTSIVGRCSLKEPSHSEPGEGNSLVGRASLKEQNLEHWRVYRDTNEPRRSRSKEKHGQKANKTTEQEEGKVEEKNGNNGKTDDSMANEQGEVDKGLVEENKQDESNRIIEEKAQSMEKDEYVKKGKDGDVNHERIEEKYNIDENQEAHGQNLKVVATLKREPGEMEGGDGGTEEGDVESWDEVLEMVTTLWDDCWDKGGTGEDDTDSISGSLQCWPLLRPPVGFGGSHPPSSAASELSLTELERRARELDSDLEHLDLSQPHQDMLDLYQTPTDPQTERADMYQTHPGPQREKTALVTGKYNW
ncbi:hypothetical protein D4764_16G0001370 [Takifugu flavidus]|uniref:Uncharacterized protein n=1 Tax=Takifugu flavidus TaxID=433684 RepID=A0A5C6P0L0_9TELE|nr:hypothetical protein D4764_16G0001370 [Takifugu flavidus]